MPPECTDSRCQASTWFVRPPPRELIHHQSEGLHQASNDATTSRRSDSEPPLPIVVVSRYPSSPCTQWRAAARRGDCERHPCTALAPGGCQPPCGPTLHRPAHPAGASLGCSHLDSESGQVVPRPCLDVIVVKLPAAPLHALGAHDILFLHVLAGDIGPNLLPAAQEHGIAFDWKRGMAKGQCSQPAWPTSVGCAGGHIGLTATSLS